MNAESLSGAGEPAAQQEVGELTETWRRLRQNKAALVGGVIVTMYILVAILSPLLAPYHYSEGDAKNRLLAPWLAFWISENPLADEFTHSPEISVEQLALDVKDKRVFQIVIDSDSNRMLIRYRDGATAVVVKAPDEPVRDLLMSYGLTLMQVTSVQVLTASPQRDPRFLLGTDMLGRDVLSRILFGARISLQIQLGTVALAVLIGTVLGLTSGYRGGALDEAIMRGMDIFMAFPGIFLALAFVSAFRARFDPLISLVLAVGLTSVPRFARIVRGSVLSVKEKEYVEAARAIGETSFSIVCRYVLPNVLTPLIVATTLRMATVLLTASGLGFLGLGAQPPIPEWGLMISEARDYLLSASHALLVPAIAIIIVVLGFNLFGDGLRDALDPRMKV
jgi:peptide/nickel transport system permease protein